MAPQQFSPKNKRLVMIVAIIVVFVILLAILLPGSKPAPENPAPQPAQQQQAAAPAAPQKASEKATAKAPEKAPEKATAKAPQNTLKPPKKLTQKEIDAERKAALAIKDPAAKLAAIDEFVRKHGDNQDQAVYKWVTAILQTRAGLVKGREAQIRVYDQIVARYPDRSALDDWSSFQVTAAEFGKTRMMKDGPDRIALLDHVINSLRGGEDRPRRAMYARALNRKAAIISDIREKAALYDTVFSIPSDEENKGLIREYAHAILKRADLSSRQEKQQLLSVLATRFDSIEGDPVVENYVLEAKMQLTVDMPDETALLAYKHMLERYGDIKSEAIQNNMKIVNQRLKELQDKMAGANG